MPRPGQAGYGGHERKKGRSGRGEGPPKRQSQSDGRTVPRKIKPTRYKTEEAHQRTPDSANKKEAPKAPLEGSAKPWEQGCQKVLGSLSRGGKKGKA